MKDLTQLRKEIDELDSEFMGILAKRMKLVQAVGEYKKKNNIDVVDMNRWQQVLTGKLLLAKKMGLNESLVEDIYNRIHEAAIDLEKEVK